jgi:alpha-1,6-mannosyltransferase
LFLHCKDYEFFMRIIAPSVFYGTVAAIVLGLLLLHLPTAHPVLVFGCALMGGSFFYLLMAAVLPRIDLSAKAIFSLLAVSLLLRLSFISTIPIGSEDAYRYLWDGKVQANGINPYLYTALDPRLDSLHSPLLPAAMNHADLKTIYFPFSQWIFFSCYLLSGESLWSYKLLYLAAETLTIVGLLLVLSRSKVDRKYVLLYALCPLPILEFAVDAHLDAVGLPLFVFALFFYQSERKVLSYLLLGLSFSIKPVGLIALPALFFFTKGWRNRLSTVGIPILVVGAQFLPYLYGSNPFETLFSFTKNWSFNGPLFEIFYSFINNNQTARIYCSGVLALLIIVLILRRGALFDTIYFSLLFLILCSPVVHPWYVCWLAVLLPLLRRRSGIALVAGVSLTSFTVMHYRMTGVWEQYPIVLLIEYLPVVALAAMELRDYFASGEKSSLV